MSFTISNAIMRKVLQIVDRNLNVGTRGRLQHLSYALIGHKIIPNSISTCSKAGMRHLTTDRCCSDSAHSEMNSVKSFFYAKKRSNITLVVVRCRKRDDSLQLVMSRPCIRCSALLHRVGVRWVIYSVPDGLRRRTPKQLMAEAVPSLADRVIRKTLYVRNDAHRRIASRQKKIELRIPRCFAKSLHRGIIINVSNGAGEICVARITRIRKYSPSGDGAADLLRHILKKEGLNMILPHIETVPEGVRYLLYGKAGQRPVFSWHKVTRYGVWAFELDTLCNKLLVKK